MKLGAVVLVTAVLAATTVNGHLPLSVQKALERFSSKQTELVEDTEIAATASNATIDSILSELNINRRKRQSTGCFPTGLYGGKGGGAFHELPDDCQATIKKIVLRTGSLVDSIQVTYRLSNGKDYTAGYYGGKGGGKNVINVNIEKGEKIIGAFGKTGRLVDNIGFFTNKGKVFGPYGGKGGGDFTVHLCSIRGIFGRVGSLVDSIGFYCGKLSC